MSDPRRFYIQHNYGCPECRCVLRFERRRDTSDSLILVHDTFPNGCSRNGKMYYAPVVELEPFRYEATPGPPATAVLDAIAPPVKPYMCPCDECRKARANAEKRTTIAANLRPPFETFKRATCKGSYVLGSACGMCERCTWERSQMGFKS